MCPPLTDEQKRKYRKEHIPHRLAHLENLVWACHAIETYDTSDPLPPATVTVGDECGGRLEHRSFRGVTNSLFDIGVVSCRVLLNFMGVYYEGSSDRLTYNGRAWESDVFWRDVFGSGWVPETVVNLSDQCPELTRDRLEGAYKGVFEMANKAVAHLTMGHRSGDDVGRAKLCALAILNIFDKYAYGGAMPCLLLCDGKPIWEQELEEFVRTRATAGNAISPEAARATSAAAPAIVTRMGQAPTRAEA